MRGKHEDGISRHQGKMAVFEAAAQPFSFYLGLYCHQCIYVDTACMLTLVRLTRRRHGADAPLTPTKTIKNTIMKKLIFVFLLFLFSPLWLAAQCPTDITFTSQSQIDSFPINYPGCTQILGFVQISESIPGDITNLDGLSTINYFGKNLFIAGNASLNNLHGLHNVDSVGWSLALNDNAAMTSLSGLDKLKTVGLSSSDGGELFIEHDSALTTLSGLGNLTTVAGHFYILETPALTNISSLNNLTFVGKQFVVESTALTSINSLSNLTHASEVLIINNPELTSLSGLDNIESSTITIMFLYNNPQLNVCNVESVCEYLENGGGNTYVSNNAIGCNTVPEIEASCQASPTKEQFSKQFEILVFPTINTGLIHIECGEYLDLTYRIYNTVGKLIKSEQFNTKISVDISNAPNGMYFVEVQNGTQSTIKKILKR